MVARVWGGLAAGCWLGLLAGCGCTTGPAPDTTTAATRPEGHRVTLHIEGMARRLDLT
jgi:hypothetical protein